MKSAIRRPIWCPMCRAISRTVTMEEVGKDRVLVTGATGHAPPEKLKACATWDDGWRAIAYQPVIGPAAAEKAAKQAEALFERGSHDAARARACRTGGGPNA